MKTDHDGEEVLVTGGGGFLGCALVRQLVARGDRVTSLARRSYPALQRWGVRQIQADIADTAMVEEACRSKDLVFHTAAKAGVWGPYDAFYRTNVIGTENVIKGCRAHDVPRLIYTGSPSVVFNGRDMAGIDETTPYPDKYEAAYPATKAAAEQRVLAAARKGVAVIVLRPHLIWGPGDNHLVPRIIARAKTLRRIGNGCNRVDTTYIDNAAEAHLQAADRLKAHPQLSGRIYFISQDEPMPLWDMVDAILAAGGLAPVKGSIPKNLAVLIGLALETSYKILHIATEPRMTRFVAKELATEHWFDLQAAKTDLGYRPRITTAEGLKRLAQWLAEPKLEE